MSATFSSVPSLFIEMRPSLFICWTHNVSTSKCFALRPGPRRCMMALALLLSVQTSILNVHAVWCSSKCFVSRTELQYSPSWSHWPLTQLRIVTLLPVSLTNDVLWSTDQWPILLQTLSTLSLGFHPSQRSISFDFSQSKAGSLIRASTIPFPAARQMRGTCPHVSVARPKRGRLRNSLAITTVRVGILFCCPFCRGGSEVQLVLAPLCVPRWWVLIHNSFSQSSDLIWTKKNHQHKIHGNKLEGQPTRQRTKSVRRIHKRNPNRSRATIQRHTVLEPLWSGTGWIQHIF